MPILASRKGNRNYEVNKITGTGLPPLEDYYLLYPQGRRGTLS
jgi:hypothetical protein